MIAATELASDRVPLSEAGILSAIMLAAWVPVALIKGDYRVKRKDTLYYNVILLNAMQNSMTTWMLAVPVALAVYSYLAPENVVDALVLLLPEDSAAHLPPQLEVMVADLITLCCWRGVYAILRL